MAYTKQTWLDRIGTFLNRFTKSNENLTSVELINNPGTITQAGTAFSASRMNYMESGIENAHRIATPLSDLSRVMRINGDGVPTFPDNVAGEVYRSNFSTLDGWIISGGTISVVNGELIATATATAMYVSRALSSGSGRQIRITLTSPTWGLNFVGRVNGVDNATIPQRGYEQNKKVNIDAYVAGTLEFITTGYVEIAIGSKVIISEAYIGSGLYDTPVYGKDGQTVAVNHGAVPVNGPRGKGLLFQGGQYLQADNPIVGISGTLAVKLKNITSGIIAWNESYNANGFSLFKISSILTVLRLSYNGNNIQINISCTDNSTMCICFTNGSINIYVDSIIVATSSFSNITQGTNNLRIGAEISNTSLQGVLEDIRYDTAIWTQNEVTRYHNGDDAVDSQQKSVTPVPHSIVTRDANGGINASNMFAYDLVIDSDAKLAAWAASGTWEKVLIKKGTWTLASGGVDLTARGTKLVFGEPGSKLVFSSAEKGLYYTTTPTTEEYRMDGVTVEATGTSNTVGFSSCTNIINCTGTGTGTGTSNTVGFSSCTNIINCTGTGTGTGTGTSYGFVSCTNMTNCTGTGTGTDGYGYGFVSCKNMTNCTGTGTGTGGYGFSGCKKCQQNMATGSTAKYNASYADAGTAYPCADTPNGGFNS